LTELKINGLIEKPIWYAIKCCCSTLEDDDEHKYPLTDCTHCKFQECEDSIPRETFEINVNETKESVDDKTKKVTITKTTKIKTIKEINIVRGNRFQDVIGWEWD